MMKSISPVNYQEYPEYMFAMVAAFLPSDEGKDLRWAAGKVEFKHEDGNGNTYKNGVLHSYNDKPAFVDKDVKIWYKEGKMHRDEDKPAVESIKTLEWYKEGKRHRAGDLPAVIGLNYERLHYCPEYISLDWWVNGERHRDFEPAVIDYLLNYQEFWTNGNYISSDDLFKIM